MHAQYLTHAFSNWIVRRELSELYCHSVLMLYNPKLLLGPALRKELPSRKVDKCGTVFEGGSSLRDGGL